MEFTFADGKLEGICSSERQMVRRFGAPMARRLGARLAELAAAATLADLRALPQTRAHELTRGRDEQISLDLAQPYRLVLQVANEPVPRLQQGGLDWEAITSVVIIEVADTHR